MTTITINENLAERVHVAATKYKVTPTQVVEGLIEAHLPDSDARQPTVTIGDLAQIAQKTRITVGQNNISMRCNNLLIAEQKAALQQYVRGA